MPAFLIPAAIAGAAALGQGIAQAVPGKYDKYLKNRLDSLSTGGLTDEEKQARSRDLMSPVRKAQTQIGQQQAAALAASNQGLGGADLAAIRQDAGRIVGDAAQQAQTTIAQEDELLARAQREEQAQLQAALAGRRAEKKAAVLGGIASAAETMGQAVGAAPGTYSANNPFGSRVTSALETANNAGLSDIDKVRLGELVNQPGAERAAREALRGVQGEDGSLTRQFYELLDRSRRAAEFYSDPATVPLEEE